MFSIQSNTVEKAGFAQRILSFFFHLARPWVNLGFLSESSISYGISSEISFKECLFKNSLFSTNLKEKCLVRCKIGEYFIRIAYKSNWNSKTKLGKEFKMRLSRDNTILGVSKNSDTMPNDCQGWHQHNEAMFSM